jgi:hypothetical protein
LNEDTRREGDADKSGAMAARGHHFPTAVQRVILKQAMKNTLKTLGRSKGPMGFYDKRATTGYKYASGKNQQGSHTMGHVTKRVAMAAAVNTGLDPLKLRRSSAFPRPRVMNKMLRDRLRLRGAGWRRGTRKLRTTYLHAYLRAWRGAHKATTAIRKLNFLRKGIELNPATVYNIGSGKTTKKQIAGKGENRKKSARDLRRLIKKPNDLSGMSTIDLSGATKREKTDTRRMVGAFGKLLRNEQIDSDSGSSSSDSELELDE